MIWLDPATSENMSESIHGGRESQGCPAVRRVFVDIGVRSPSRSISPESVGILGDTGENVEK